jgi:hypothetical protein
MTKDGNWGTDGLVECLSSKYKALTSKPSTTKKKKDKNWNPQEGMKGIGSINIKD